MIREKVARVCVLFYVLNLLLSESIVSTTKIECIPLKFCPLALNLIKTKPHAPETIAFLRYSHCDYNEDGANIWCPLILDTCKTPDSRDGVCKNINDCDTYIQYMEEMDLTNPIVKKYLRAFRCSTDEQGADIRVCCPPGKTKATIPRATTTSITISAADANERFSNGLPHPNMGECGQQKSENKIVGGTDTNLDEYPWLALLKYVKKNQIKYACSGALINDRYVLTAAHCIDPFIVKSKDLGKLQNIILGEYDTRNETDCIYEQYGSECADPLQVFTPNDYVVHPKYNSSIMVNDIAIIRLDRKVKFSDYVQPICLPSINFQLQGNESFTISGWGRTEFEKKSFTKRKARLDYVDEKNCNKYNGVRKISKQQICAGKGQGVDSCYGDSGGPLMLERKVKGGTSFFAIGIVSYGYGQLCGSFPGVYTYIPPFLNWIVEQIR